jgi:hypothetical protein
LLIMVLPKFQGPKRSKALIAKTIHNHGGDGALSVSQYGLPFSPGCIRRYPGFW